MPPKALKLRYAFLTLYSFRLLARREVRQESRLHGSCGQDPRPIRPPLYHKSFFKPSVLKFDFFVPMSDKHTKAPTIDPKACQRNKTTAWLEFLDRLSS